MLDKSVKVLVDRNCLSDNGLFHDGLVAKTVTLYVKFYENNADYRDILVLQLLTDCFSVIGLPCLIDCGVADRACQPITNSSRLQSRTNSKSKPKINKKYFSGDMRSVLPLIGSSFKGESLISHSSLHTKNIGYHDKVRVIFTILENILLTKYKPSSVYTTFVLDRLKSNEREFGMQQYKLRLPGPVIFYRYYRDIFIIAQS